MNNLSKVLKRAIDDTHRPGNTIVISGRRGGGKSHLAVWLMEYLISKGWIILTNILFMRKISDNPIQFEEAYPQKIKKITSMAEMYYFAAQILKENRTQKIAVIRDEAQNYIVAFRSSSMMEVEMFRAEGDYRKFNILSIYITPTFEYIPKGIRKQYVKARWYKPDVGVKRNEFMFEVIGALPVKVQVPIGKWNKSWHDVKIGEYVYDHMSSASLDLGYVGGKEFNIQEFRRYYTGKIFSEIPDAILEYFSMKGGIDTLNRNVLDEEDEKKFVEMCFAHGIPPVIKGTFRLWDYVDLSRSTIYRMWNARGGGDIANSINDL